MTPTRRVLLVVQYRSDGVRADAFAEAFSEDPRQPFTKAGKHRRLRIEDVRAFKA